MRFLLVLACSLLCALSAAAPALGAADPLRPRQWGLDMVEADQAHANSTGAGAVVAVVDTGVLAGHPDLAGRLVPGYDFVQNDSTPQDGNGHGTHVTGIIAADSGNGVGGEGVAPGARVMPIRVLGDDGTGDSDTVVKGIDYAVAHHADVINLSLGDLPGGSIAGSDAAFAAALNRALDAGVVVVAAAGNDGLPVCEQPGTSGRLLCVGAVDKRGLRSVFSSFGMGVGVMAPGGSALPGTDEDVLSTWNDGGYQELAGTSQAAPHVAGVAALLVSLGLHGQAVVDRIAATARDAGAPGPDPEYGNGIVDARAAVAGLTPLAGSPAAGGSGGPSVSIPAKVRIRTFLRRGLVIRCHAAGASRCSVRALAGRRLAAKGSRKLGGGATGRVAAHATRAGRASVHGARSVTLNVVVTLSGRRFRGRVKLVR